MNSIGEKVDQMSARIGRLERVIIHVRNKQDEVKSSEIHSKSYKVASKGQASKGSLPGPIPDRSTTLPGGATVIPV